MTVEEIKQMHVGKPCLLDGERATVKGWNLPYAMICGDGANPRSVEFSWPAVERIMAAGVNFLTEIRARSKA